MNNSLRRLLSVFHSKAPAASSQAGEANTSFNNESSSWSGFDALEHLFIFGDSYSAIGFAANLPPPKTIDRNSVPYKGLTYADEDGTNWVGYILAQHNPHQNMLVHDYAAGGARVPASSRGAGSVERQVDEYFLNGYAMKTQAVEGSEDAELIWKPANSLFVSWVGINDCASASTHDETLELLFGLQEKLYNAGARQFLFIDVPPIKRTPAGAKTMKYNPTSDFSASYLNWNASLRAHAITFATAHPDARVFTFSAFNTFNNILDRPRSYNIKPKDVTRAGGQVWRDLLHPTSRIHKIFASELVEFLRSVDVVE